MVLKKNDKLLPALIGGGVVLAVVGFLAWQTSPAHKIQVCESGASRELQMCLSREAGNAAELVRCYSISQTKMADCKLTPTEIASRNAEANMARERDAAIQARVDASPEVIAARAKVEALRVKQTREYEERMAALNAQLGVKPTE